MKLRSLAVASAKAHAPWGSAYLRIPDNTVSLEPFANHFRMTLVPVFVKIGFRHALFARHEDGDFDKVGSRGHCA